MAKGGLTYGPGAGPPNGTPVITLDEAQEQIRQQAGTPGGIARDDPAFVNGVPAATKGLAELYFRELPLVTIQNSWSVQAVRGALNSNMYGIFEPITQLWEVIMGDDRVQATIGSRIAGLFGREIRVTPANGSAAAKEVAQAWEDALPYFVGGSGLRTCHAYSIGLGWVPAQLVWDTTKPIWKPRPVMWNPRFSFYHWALRRYIALSMDGSLPIIAGDGKWMVHAPWGEYRGWVFGAVRAVAEPWLLRHFAFRDMARYSEVHGLPIRIAETPAAADPTERSEYAAKVAALGSETTLLLGKGVDEQNSYGFSLVEAKDPAWEVFSALISQCDMAIILAIMFQNLTTEVDSGSFAATKAHMDVRQNGIQADNAAWKHTLYHQVCRPFAQLNFGDPDLAPWTEWDVSPLDQIDSRVERFQKFMTGVEVGRRGGWKFKDAKAATAWAGKTMGFDDLPEIEITDPVAAGMGGDPNEIPFAPLDPSQIVKVNEARKDKSLPPIPGGDVTIAEFHADKDADRTKDVTEAGEKSKEEHAPPPPPAAPHAEPDGDEGGAGSAPPPGKGSK